MKQRADGRWLKVKSINGKKVYFYSTAKTEKAAVKDIEKQMLEYAEKEEKGKTFQDVAEEWEERHICEVSKSTSKRYKPCIRRAVDEFGQRYIKQITTAEIDGYIKGFSLKFPTTKTVKMQRSVINLIFKYAILKGYTTINPCQYVQPPKNLQQHRRELPHDSEIEKINKGIDCTFGMFAYLILYTGLRRGEALALTHGDIDMKNGLIHVTKSLIHDSNEPKLTSPKTEAGIRDVVLLDCLKKVLPKGKRDTLLFPNDKGEYLHQSNFNRLWKKYKEESGVTVTPHQLRHAYATILYEAGIADKDAQELMGHTNISLTRDIYTYISKSRLGVSKRKLNEFLNGQ